MRKLTIKDVAKEAGVSTATISRVLNNNGYVSVDVRENVLATIKKLNYTPNSIARSLKQEKSRSIGIIFPDMANPYFIHVAKQIQNQCIDEGYHLLLMDSGEDLQKEREALRFLMEKRVEALILAGLGGNLELIRSIRASGIHVILIDRKIEGLDTDVIAEDNQSVSEEAVKYLLEQGNNDIGILNGPQHIVTARERFEGVKAAFHKKGKQLDETYVYQGDYSRDSGRAGIHYLMSLSPSPTAVFSANNEMTFGLYLGLMDLGINPVDIEVVSFGDLEFSSLFQHKLTVIMQNPKIIGELAAETVLKHLNGTSHYTESRITFPRLVHRF